jgi:hypothetical protein
MKFNAVAAAFSLGLTIAVGPGADATASDRRSPRETRLAQVRPEAADATADKLRGIGLTASHKRIIFDHIGTEQAQTVPNNAELSVGSTIPDSGHGGLPAISSRAPCPPDIVMSALGQKQTFAPQKDMSRFAPKSGHVRCTSLCRADAVNGSG